MQFVSSLSSYYLAAFACSSSPVQPAMLDSLALAVCSPAIAAGLNPSACHRTALACAAAASCSARWESATSKVTASAQMASLDKTAQCVSA